MARYQVSIIERARQWRPASPDDVPPRPGEPLEVLAEADDLFAAVRQAIEHNEAAQQDDRPRWAVVVEPGVPGRAFAGARLCTPLSYKVAAVWWPAGWEPQSPLDVPNCVWKAQGEADQEPLGYRQALATVQGLNRQSMSHPGSMWYVLVAVENEPVSQTVSYDPAGTETTVEVRPLHVVRPEEGGGRGDCSHCPARSYSCAREHWDSLEQTTTATRTRSVGGRA